MEANWIIVADNLHALTFSDIATSRQLQIITSSRSNILSSCTLEVIPSPKSAIKQERRRAYRRKRSSRGSHLVEPRSITSPSSPFTDCESDSLASIDSVTATNSNYEKVGFTSSAIPIRDSTSVLVVKSFSNRSFSNSIQNSIPNYPPRCFIEIPVFRKSFALPTITINPVRKPPQPRIVYSKLLHSVLPIIHLPSLTTSTELCESLQISEEDTILPSVQTTMALDTKCMHTSKIRICALIVVQLVIVNVSNHFAQIVSNIIFQ